MQWFERMFGFLEYGDNVRANITVDDEFLVSRVNGRRFRAGVFTTPTVADLEQRGLLQPATHVSNTVAIVEGDVASLQAQPENNGAVFQVASQFNCLEFVNQHVTPENGVTGYIRDRTQGPAAAVSCGAAAVFRNYFVFGGEPQTRHRQLNLLDDVSTFFGNTGQMYNVKNGYVFADSAQLAVLNCALAGHAPESVYRRLRVGLVQNAQVTSCAWGTQSVDYPQTVNQVLCSALSVRYNPAADLAEWEPFARTILCGAYVATLATTIALGQRRVFLAPLGGSAFGNDPQWITDSIKHALSKFENRGLDVRLVCPRGRAAYESLLDL